MQKIFHLPHGFEEVTLCITMKMIPVLAKVIIVYIRIHYECESWIEKSVLRITNWHHESCRVMTNHDHEGCIFLSHPHTNNGFFSCSTLNTSFYNEKKIIKRAPKNPKNAKIRQRDVIFNIIMTSRIDVRLMCSCSYFIPLLGWCG